MGSDGCQCEALEANQEARRLQWKELCTQFYYDQDEKAKRILDYFEATKVDEIIISTPDKDQNDAQFSQLVQFLGLQKCMLPGHQDIFYQKNVQMLDLVKNQVRAGYHTQVANLKYAEFDERANVSQGTNYELWADESGRQKLAVRVQHDYLRMTEKQLQMMQRMETFIEKHFSNVGSHPFLAGLRATLQWNLESSTVVAWSIRRGAR
ncbi:hypothetical protein BBJ29_006501 [Phytophthora kernoviae]|uniref:Uncharacterized protein n=1 Tax=Phytophthora kernoviae TaxID=325452 RepID=A0A3F2RK01_9STRA|nr:hypothetical protein BBJ29_006501 [Phytophthora kernoviae]RLN57816.1 hypothetical protein BBP00_00007332 [Phytophthora kernoviae]